MKKSVILVLAILLGFTGIIGANASACSNSELVKLKKIASAVSTVYEEKEVPVEAETKSPEMEGTDVFTTYFKINVTNVTEDIYIKVLNDHNDEVKFIRYQDTNDGIYSFDWYDLDDLTKFTFVAYSSSKTSCPDEKLFTGYLVTPMLNRMADTLICEGINIPECQKYITAKMDPTDQYNKINEYIEKKIKEEEKKNKKWYQRVGDFVTEHKFLTGFSIVVIGGVATTVVVKNKRKRVK